MGWKRREREERQRRERWGREPHLYTTTGRAVRQQKHYSQHPSELLRCLSIARVSEHSTAEKLHHRHRGNSGISGLWTEGVRQLCQLATKDDCRDSAARSTRPEVIQAGAWRGDCPICPSLKNILLTITWVTPGNFATEALNDSSGGAQEKVNRGLRATWLRTEVAAWQSQKHCCLSESDTFCPQYFLTGLQLSS